MNCNRTVFWWAGNRMALCAMFFSLAACATTWTEQRADWHPRQPVPALLVHFSVAGFLENQETSPKWWSATKAVASALVDVALPGLRKASLSPEQEFMESAYALLATTLQSFGMTLTIDATRVAKLENDPFIITPSSADTLIYPGTSDQSFHNLGPALFGPGFRQTVPRVLGSK